MRDRNYSGQKLHLTSDWGGRGVRGAESVPKYVYFNATSIHRYLTVFKHTQISLEYTKQCCDNRNISPPVCLVARGLLITVKIFVTYVSVFCSVLHIKNMLSRSTTKFHHQQQQQQNSSLYSAENYIKRSLAIRIPHPIFFR